MKKRIFLTSALGLLLSTASHATFHQYINTDIPGSMNSVKLDIGAPSSIITAYISNSEGEGFVLNAELIQRGSQGYRRLSTETLPLTDIYGSNEFNQAAVLDVGHDIGNHYFLLSARSCSGEDSCTTVTNRIVKTDLEGNAETINSVVFNAPSCDTAPSIVSKDIGFGVLSGCGVITWFDGDLNIASETALPAFPGDAAVQVKESPWIGIADETELTPENIQFLVGALSGSVGERNYQVWRLDNDGAVINQYNVPISGKSETCELMEGTDANGVVCEQDGGLYAYSLEGESGETPLDVYVPEGSEFAANADWQVTGHDGHAYLQYQVTLDSGEDDVVQVRHIVSNIDIASGERYAYHDIESALSTQNEMHLEKETYFALSPDGFTAAIPYVNSKGNVGLSIYEALSEFSEPVLTGLNNARVLTGNETTVDIPYQDEQFLSSEIQVRGEFPVGWISINNGTDEITFTPSHADAGESSYVLTLTTPEHEVEFERAVTATLTPLSLLVYEEGLFEQLEQEEPLPLGSVLDAISFVPAVEDETIEIAFTLNEREADEVALQWGDLPTFMSWSSETLTLTVSPKQQDVGNTTVTLTSTDSYADEGYEGVVSYELPIRVIEVDEPPVITSEGVTTAIVGQAYTYRMTFDDEETESSQMRVSLEVGPPWLSYNRDGHTLTGTPSEAYAGSSSVQLTVRDGGGNIVVHSYTLTVSYDPEAEKGGGSFGYALFVLLAGTVCIRRRTVRSN